VKRRRFICGVYLYFINCIYIYYEIKFILLKNKRRAIWLRLLVISLSNLHLTYCRKCMYWHTEPTKSTTQIKWILGEENYRHPAIRCTKS